MQSSGRHSPVEPGFVGYLYFFKLIFLSLTSGMLSDRPWVSALMPVSQNDSLLKVWNCVWAVTTSNSHFIVRICVHAAVTAPCYCFGPAWLWPGVVPSITNWTPGSDFVGFSPYLVDPERRENLCFRVLFFFILCGEQTWTQMSERNRGRNNTHVNQVVHSFGPRCWIKKQNTKKQVLCCGSRCRLLSNM